jgi:teichuronic acid biosynthesis glycosyltransferase TuaG
VKIVRYDPELISIVCPARDSSAYLARAIDSILAQTAKNWELLIVDDGSLDETGSIARCFASKDSRISVLANEVGLGVARSRNLGLDAARGRWVAFLDSDDAWLPEKLTKTVSFAKQNESPLTFTGYRASSPDGGEVGPYMDVPSRVNYRQLLTLNVIATSSVLLDRGLTGPIQMKDGPSSDFVCWLEILRKHELAWGLSEDLVRYSLTRGSLSRNKARVPGKIWRIYRSVENLSFSRAILNFITYAFRSGKKHLYMTKLG